MIKYNKLINVSEYKLNIENINWRGRELGMIWREIGEVKIMIKTYFMKNFNNYKSPKGKYKKIKWARDIKICFSKENIQIHFMKRYITWLIIGEMHRKIPNEIH